MNLHRKIRQALFLAVGKFSYRRMCRSVISKRIDNMTTRSLQNLVKLALLAVATQAIAAIAQEDNGYGLCSQLYDLKAQTAALSSPEQRVQVGEKQNELRKRLRAAYEVRKDPAALYCLGADMLEIAVETLRRYKGEESNYPSVVNALNQLMHSAKEMLEGAAEQGVELAYEPLGQIYESGYGTPKSAFVAIEYYSKSAHHYLRRDDRLSALRMLERMIKLAPQHPLVVELSAQLYSTKQPDNRSGVIEKASTGG